jgi:hypothetical protein
MSCCGSACAPRPAEARPERCPRCGQRGRLVAPLTLRSILRPDRAGEVDDLVAYGFCPNRSCDALYFDAGEWIATKRDARVRVGIKETTDPLPLCYCFGFARADVRHEVATTGACAIPDRITAEVRAGRCACEVKNPSGSCCLGEVRRAVKEAQAELAAAAAREGA